MKTPAEFWIERAWDALEANDNDAAAQHALHVLRIDAHATDGLLALSQTIDVRTVRSALLREAVRISKEQLEARLGDAEGVGVMEMLDGHRHVWALRALGRFLADSPDPPDQGSAEAFESEADRLDPEDACHSKANFPSGDSTTVQADFGAGSLGCAS